MRAQAARDEQTVLITRAVLLFGLVVLAGSGALWAADLLGAELPSWGTWAPAALGLLAMLSFVLRRRSR